MEFSIEDKTIHVKLNSDIYSPKIISKSLYWLINNYIIEQKALQGFILISFTPISVTNDFQWHIQKIQKAFVDFQLREIVENETKTIRELIIAKAFYPIEEHCE